MPKNPSKRIEIRKNYPQPGKNIVYVIQRRREQDMIIVKQMSSDKGLTRLVVGFTRKYRVHRHNVFEQVREENDESLQLKVYTGWTDALKRVKQQTQVLS